MSAFEALEKPSRTFSLMLPLVNAFKIALLPIRQSIVSEGQEEQ